MESPKLEINDKVKIKLTYSHCSWYKPGKFLVKKILKNKSGNELIELLPNPWEGHGIILSHHLLLVERANKYLSEFEKFYDKKV